MKKNIFFSAIIAVLAFTLGFIFNAWYYNDEGLYEANQYKYQLIQAYDSYNKATEELLDTLDKEYNWVDSLDPEEYYDSREKLDSLLYKEQ